MAKPIPINFTDMVASKAIQGGGPDAKPVPRQMVLKAVQLMEPDTSDREESLKADWTEFLASIQATAGTSQQGAGNFTPIIVVGAQAPFEIVAGRRRYLACRELGLPVDAKVYPFLNDEDKARFRYAENFHRNNYTPYETIANIKRELGRGRDRTWLCAVIGKTMSSIDAYIAIAKDARLTEEVKRGLSRREASRLLHEFGKNAAVEAAKLRQADGPQEQEAHTATKAKRKAAKETQGESLLVTKIVPGLSALIKFDEKNANKNDIQAYGKCLDEERERVGALIDARSKRGQARI
jgi:ParB/RepB/Spo0J family partition protein